MSKPKKWTFRTGGHRWIGNGKTWQEAIRVAWKKRPPESVGFLVQIDTRDEVTAFMLGETALRAAGFKPPKISLKEYAEALR